MNGGSFLLDTNVILGFLSGKGWATSFVTSALGGGADLAVSVVTRMELLAFSGISAEEESALSRFLGAITVVPLTRDVENEAIRLRRAHRLRLPDAIVAASAVVTGAVLVTGDRQILNVSGIRTLDPAAG